MDQILVDVVSESAALRTLNLPATDRWKRYLRETLPFSETQAGRLYPQVAVDRLAEKVADFAAETMPLVEESSSSTSTSRSNSTRSGIQTR